MPEKSEICESPDQTVHWHFNKLESSQHYQSTVNLFKQ